MLRKASVLDPLRSLKAWGISRWQHRNFVSGMTSVAEQNYFHSYARDTYTGKGEIVDLGCLMGSTTIPLAQGLASNSRVSNKQRRIHAYDLFEWHPWMGDSNGALKRRYAEGESFLSEYEDRIAPFSQYVAIHAGDVTRLGWSGSPIEFLLVDLNKSWELCDYVYRTFFLRLVPGVSLILEQDFKHFYTPWIHIMHHRLRDFFEFHYDVKNSCSVVFRLRRAIEPVAILKDDLMSIGDDELEEVYAHSLSLLGPGHGWEQSNIIASKVMFYIHLDRLEEARSAFERALADGYTRSSDLARAEQFIENGKIG